VCTECVCMHEQPNEAEGKHNLEIVLLCIHVLMLEYRELHGMDHANAMRERAQDT